MIYYSYEYKLFCKFYQVPLVKTNVTMKTFTYIIKSVVVIAIQASFFLSSDITVLSSPYVSQATQTANMSFSQMFFPLSIFTTDNHTL